MLKCSLNKKCKLRIFYWSTVSILFIGFILPIFFFFYLFDANNVKQMLIQQFNTENYIVNINGGVFPKTWHGLSLELSWFDLIIGKYKVKRLSLNGVLLNNNGIQNTDLHKLLKFSKTNNSVFSDLQYLNFYNINSKNGGCKYKITNGALEISQLVSNPQFNLTAQLNNNTSHITITGKVGTVDYDSVNFNDINVLLTSNKGSINLQAKASYQIANQTISLDKINGNVNLPLYKGDIAINNILLSWNNLIAQNITVQLITKNTPIMQKIYLNIKNFNTPAFSTLNLESINLNYHISSNKNKLNLESTANKMSLDTNFNMISSMCSNNLIITSPTLKNSTLNANLNGSCIYNSNSNKINLDLKGNLNNQVAKLKLQIDNNESTPYITVSGALDNLDLSSIIVNKADVMPLYSDKSELPFSWLGLFNMDANLNFKKFIFDRVNLNNVQAQFSITKDELNIKQLQADLYSGKLIAQAKVTKFNNAYNISSKQIIHNFQLQNLFMNLFNISAISGNGNIDINMTANNVSTYDDIRKQISGWVAIDATKGQFEGVDFDLFLHPSSLTNLKVKKATVFNQLIAQFDFKKGISANSILRFSSPNVVANGVGSIDFIKSSLDYNLSIKSVLPKNADKVQSVLIPIKINGNLFAPQINIQNIQLNGQSATPKKHKSNQHVRQK